MVGRPFRDLLRFLLSTCQCPIPISKINYESDTSSLTAV
jgi:hypothetical protein